jgi:glutamine amidotransferase
VIGKRVPFLGICLGLQFLAQTSDEFGEHKGLGWVDGVVRRIVPADPATKVPHMGWNEVTLVGDDPLFAGLGPEPVFYFLHSYYLDVAESASSIVTSTCWHGARLTASVRRDNVVAVQFHPEKSQEAGLRLLRNFVAEVGRARC